MSNRTPPPWTAKKSTQYFGHLGTVIWGPELGQKVAFVGDRLPEHVANARLISAAPELLAAAKLAGQVFARALDSDDKCDTAFMGDDEHEAWEAIKTAIAKAEATT